MPTINELQRAALERLAAGDTVDIFAGTEYAPNQRWWPRGAKGNTLQALQRRGLIISRRFGQWDSAKGGRDSFGVTADGYDVLGTEAPR